MPKESFYAPDIAEDQDVEFAHARALNVAWGAAKSSDVPQGVVFLAGGIPLDESGVDRLIRVLRRAKRQVWPEEVMPGVFSDGTEPGMANPHP